jgi:microsomal dipeptidase-like Zn-dependent dipeptidase
LHNGLSDLGKKVITEMNKYGMMIEVSHPSKSAMRDIIQLSKSPIIASHSSARSLCNHSRNLDDEQLMWLKENGGVVQTVAFASYINTEKANAFSKKVNEEYLKQAKEMDFEILSWEALTTLSSEKQEAYRKKYQDVKLQAKYRIDSLNKVADPVNVSDFVDHIDYMVNKIGIDHVGISSDFDGGGGIYGWNDASESFNVTHELVKRGYTENEIALLWGGNLLRVLDEVQKIANELSKT